MAPLRFSNKCPPRINAPPKSPKSLNAPKEKKEEKNPINIYTDFKTNYITEKK